jgi:hypothetical protein
MKALTQTEKMMLSYILKQTYQKSKTTKIDKQIINSIYKKILIGD